MMRLSEACGRAWYTVGRFRRGDGRHGDLVTRIGQRHREVFGHWLGARDSDKPNDRER